MALKKIKQAYLRIISEAIEEDIGSGDLTSLALFSDKDIVRAKIIFKEKGIFCGRDAVRLTYGLISPKVKVKMLVYDGEVVVKGQDVAIISGPARAVLMGERIVLNFISRLSGIATLTNRYVEVSSGKVSILDTRKTTPAWRVLEKYAVSCGGGKNHRMGLFDQILIKDNHIKALSRILNITEKQAVIEAIRRAKLFLRESGIKAKVEVEVENISWLKSVLKEKPDIVMLDNMSNAEIKKAVEIIRSEFPKVKIEISGNMTVSRVSQLSSSGVDWVSVGALTHSAKAIDVSMEIFDKV